MKHPLGLVSVSFREHTPEEILKAMQGTPLTCIEWGSDLHCPPEKAEEIAALQERYSITCCSYGTYFRLGVTPMEELPQYINATKTLGTDILRLWCGNKNSEDYTPMEKESLFALCRRAAETAKKENVILCMECHIKTFTNRKEAALELMAAVDSPHLQMYWQPNQFRTEEENLAYAQAIAPYTKRIHVFNWKEKEKFPLKEGMETWQKYLTAFDCRPLLLEFMPDGRIESLPAEAESLRKLI